MATYEYDAFGNLLKETGTVENPYRYAGYRYDEVTGLYYLQSRYYNPETGRFLTRDTFEGTEREPLRQNLYSYAKNNPIIYIDPDGKNPIVRWLLKATAKLVRSLGKKMTKHAARRMAQRGIVPRQVYNALKKGSIYNDPKYGSYVYRYRSVCVTVVKTSRIIPTVYYCSKPKKRWKKIK